ncbi:MAG: hypothetical protein ACXWDL_00675 [Nocardioides sp.]
MNTPRRLVRLLILPSVIALVLAQAPASVSSPEPGVTTEQAARATAWKCGSWKHGTTTSARWCVRFTKIEAKIKKDGQDILHNNWNRRQRMHCTMSSSTTWTFYAEGTVEAEAGVIFAKAKASVTAGGSRATTTTSEVGAEFAVPKKSYAYCSRGHGYFQLAGETRRQECSGSACRYADRGTFTGRMPSITFFEIGRGKNIPWQDFLPRK